MLPLFSDPLLTTPCINVISPHLSNLISPDERSISARLCYETSQAARKTNFLANKLFSRVRCRTQFLFLGPIPARDFGCAPPSPCTVWSVFSGPAISCIMHESAGFMAGNGMKTNNANVVGYDRQRGANRVGNGFGGILGFSKLWLQKD